MQTWFLPSQAHEQQSVGQCEDQKYHYIHLEDLVEKREIALRQGYLWEFHDETDQDEVDAADGQVPATGGLSQPSKTDGSIKKTSLLIRRDTTSMKRKM
jgi:hypothetical protein